MFKYNIVNVSKTSFGEIYLKGNYIRNKDPCENNDVWTVTYHESLFDVIEGKLFIPFQYFFDA